MIWYKKDLKVLYALIILLVISLIGIVSVFLSMPVIKHSEEEENKIVLYDSPAKIMMEIEGTCPSCKQPAKGFSGEIVCRNKDCDLYGLAIDVRYSQS